MPEPVGNGTFFLRAVGSGSYEELYNFLNRTDKIACGDGAGNETTSRASPSRSSIETMDRFQFMLTTVH